ncbi:MAG: carbon-nitrogen hydrolase family protein [Rhizobiaceae bacterium]|nr:carbon-nitrogen hydrolase family protein [Rhizobiaceae bacterium]
MAGIKATIAVAQMDCAVGETEPNLNKIAHFAALARHLGAELVIAPECAATGYFVGDRIAELADAPDGPVTRRLSAIARDNAITLICGLYTQENGIFRNSQKVFAPDGSLLATYHKAHLFASERTQYTAGDAPVVVDTPLGRLGLTICYDLIFPHYARKLVEMGAEIIVNSTNWINDPYQRDTWGWNPERVQGLASTRALENVVPLAMACRTGHEQAAPGLAFDSVAASCVVSPSGKFIARMDAGEGLAVGRIDIPAAEMERWTSVATYRIDRRPDLYR